MSPADEMVTLLKKLRLSGVLQSLDLRTRQATEDNLSHVEFMVRVLGDEVDRRTGKQLDLRMRRANFEHRRTLEDFDFHFNPRVPKAKILDLATCTFVTRRENVLLLGKSGVGKSHLAQALGHRACRLGHSVLFVAANEVFAQLRASRGDGSYERRLLRFTTPDVLICDDFGLRPLNGDEANDFYEIVRHRYEHGSIVVTSNRAMDEWDVLFANPLLASAAMDRLLHHAHVIAIDGDSFRNPKTRRTDKPAAEATP